jgi:hypothetical protein
MSRPAISVIVPCYQSEATVRETLQSVRRQSFSSWECIIVNDGSTDGGPAIAAQYAAGDRRFRVLDRENGGLSAARNTGMAATRGDFLMFLDADDLLYPPALAALRSALKRDAPAAYCGCELIGRDGRKLGSWPFPDSVRFEDLVLGNRFPVHCALLRTTAAARVGNFDTELRAMEDWDLWLRVARLGAPFLPVARPLVAYRQLPGTMSRDVRRMYRSLITILGRIGGPDPRVQGADSRYAGGCDPPVVRQSAAQSHWVFLGRALGSRDEELAHEIMEALTALQNQNGTRLDFNGGALADNYRRGARLDLECRAEEMAGAITRALPYLEKIAHRMGLPGLVEQFIQELLDPLLLAGQELRRVRGSTTYRLARLVTRCKFW